MQAESEKKGKWRYASSKAPTGKRDMQAAKRD